MATDNPMNKAIEPNVVKSSIAASMPTNALADGSSSLFFNLDICTNRAKKFPFKPRIAENQSVSLHGSDVL